MVNESLNLESWGSPILNVLPSSFPHPISLYNSQYRPAYNWKVSPLLILINSRASIGWEAQLHVIKQAPNTQISLPKLWIDPFFQTVKPSHHHGPEARREYLTHKSIILRVESHELSIMTYVLHRVGLTIITSKQQTSKMPGHLSTLYLFGEWWSTYPS